jgi:SWI/SNF-related matrix-associated actin-dependent regulator 1 of chromatin subfamily A
MSEVTVQWGIAPTTTRLIHPEMPWAWVDVDAIHIVVSPDQFDSRGVGTMTTLGASILGIRRGPHYEQAMNDIVRWMAGQRGELPSESAYRAEMLVRIEGLRQLAVAAKYAATREWLANWLDTAEGEKLVVFAHHRDAQEKLKADLADYGAVSISGGDSDDNRDAAVKRFWNDPTCRVIVCSIKAASVGLNLQCASNVAFVEFAWHAADMDQAEARCHRIGVQGAVTSYWIAGEDTFDEDMIALIESKRGVAHAAISGGEIEKQADVVAWFEKLIERKRTKEAWEGN